MQVLMFVGNQLACGVVKVVMVEISMWNDPINSLKS